MLYRILVRRDADQWRAAFVDLPGEGRPGCSPADALLRLFRESPDRRVNAFTIVATEPDSESRLRFAVSSADCSN